MLSTSNGRHTATDEYELTPKGRMGRMAMAKADTQPITTSTMAGRISRRLFYIRGEEEEEGRGGRGKNRRRNGCSTYITDCHK